LAALGERHIDPTQQICQRSFIKKYKVSFHSENQTTLPNIKQPNQHDSFWTQRKSVDVTGRNTSHSCFWTDPFQRDNPTATCQ
ncbi:hypothetical protein, partial [Brucella pseudogrignonensis]|uniref:hypothetical protein n=1 Tax=Brucella pseudogrignonensis TaxID=419475 RepID=UPI001AECB41A